MQFNSIAIEYTFVIGCVEMEDQLVGGWIDDADEVVEDFVEPVAPRGHAVDDAVASGVALVEGDGQRCHGFGHVASHQRPPLPRRQEQRCLTPHFKFIQCTNSSQSFSILIILISDESNVIHYHLIWFDIFKLLHDC